MTSMRCKHDLDTGTCSWCQRTNTVTLRNGRVTDRLENGYYQTSYVDPVALMEQRNVRVWESVDQDKERYFVSRGEWPETAGYRTSHVHAVDPADLRLDRYTMSLIDWESLQRDARRAEHAGLKLHQLLVNDRVLEEEPVIAAHESDERAPYEATAEWRKPRHRAYTRWCQDWR